MPEDRAIQGDAKDDEIEALKRMIRAMSKDREDINNNRQVEALDPKTLRLSSGSHWDKKDVEIEQLKSMIRSMTRKPTAIPIKVETMKPNAKTGASKRNGKSRSKDVIV